MDFLLDQNGECFRVHPDWQQHLPGNVNNSNNSAGTVGTRSGASTALLFLRVSHGHFVVCWCTSNIFPATKVLREKEINNGRLQSCSALHCYFLIFWLV